MTWKPIMAGQVVVHWVLANYLGVAVVGVLYFIPFITPNKGRIVSTLAIGLPIGITQWLTLRRVTPISWLWSLTMSAGILLGINNPLSGLWGFLDDESVLSLTLAFTSMGLYVGLLQWLLLRKHFGKAWVWLLNSTFGFGLAIWLVLASGVIDQGIIPSVLVTLIYSFATGMAISWMPVLTRNPKTK